MMLKKVSHIILSILIVVSTTGLTYTKHLCSAQTFPAKQIQKAGHDQHNHNSIAKSHLVKHMQMNECMEDESCTDDSCCKNESCHDDNCCRNEIQTVKLSLEYIKIENKEISKTFEFKLFLTELIVFHDIILNESGVDHLYVIDDSSGNIKTTQSFLQSFLC